MYFSPKFAPVACLIALTSMDLAMANSYLDAHALLPFKFAHQDHVETQCATCHHNYTDNTGHGLCIECHQTDERVSNLIEQQFHTLCRSCHEEKQISNLDSGPTRSCIACHQEDDEP